MLSKFQDSESFGKDVTSFGADDEDRGGDNLLCRSCNRAFQNRYNFSRHVQAGLCTNALTCSYCKKKFTRKFALERHVESSHVTSTEATLSFCCGICPSAFASAAEVRDHRETEHVVPNHNFQQIDSAHRRQCIIYQSIFPDSIKVMDHGLFLSYDLVKDLIQTLLVEKDYFTVNLVMFVEMAKLDEKGEHVQTNVFPFRSQKIIVSRTADAIPLDDVANACGDIERNVDEFLFRGSGWKVVQPLFLNAEVVECLPLAGGVPPIPLHVSMWKRSKGIMVDANEESSRDHADGLCFYYAVARHLLGSEVEHDHLTEFVEHKLKKPKEGKLSATNGDIDAFEELNSEFDLAINVVYLNESSNVLPVRASKKLNAKNQIVLFLFYVTLDKETELNTMHYALVENPQRLFARRQQNVDGGIQRTSPVFVCWNCFNTFKRKSAYDEHTSFCHENDCIKIRMPPEGSSRKFMADAKASSKAFLSAFILIFDFEALQTEPDLPCSCTKEMRENRKWADSLTDEEKKEYALYETMLWGELWENYRHDREVAKLEKKKMPRPPRQSDIDPQPMKFCTHRVRVLKEQPPFGYSYILLDRDGNVKEHKVWYGEKCAEKFLDDVLRISEKWLPSVSPGKPMDLLTAEEKALLYSIPFCYLCDKAMDVNDRVLDHDHVNGKFLGVAHNECNLHRKETYSLTCFAHNFIGYDSHFLIRAINAHDNIYKVNAVPLNTQKFKAISINNRINFVDSLAFLGDSLQKLVNTLHESGSSFPITEQCRLLREHSKLKPLLRKKGVYPYSFTTSIKRLEECRELPPIEAFYNDLTGEPCTQEDYARAVAIWKTAKCKTMLDYTTVYLTSDVYLLADVVIDFRNKIWKNFGLDMCKYLSLPHLTFDCMLKNTGVEIAHIHNQEMADLLQKSIRGGHSFVNLRHAAKEEGEWTLLYLDANNLYGWAMKTALPLEGLCWMTDEEIAAYNPEKVSE